MSTAPNQINSSKKLKGRGQWEEVWRRFKKNKIALIGVVILILFILIAIFADKLAPYGFDDQDISNSLLPPSGKYWFGTDNLGRDILSRVIYGSRISLSIGIISTLISAIGGIILGIVAGYFGGKIDNLIMRIMDVFMAIPGVLLAIAIAAALGPGIRNAMIAIGFGALPGFARVIRSSVLSIKGSQFIEAAIATNASTFRILSKYIFPNVLAPILVQTTMQVAFAILQATTLSFLGLGVQPPTPEWGSMISAGRSFLRDYAYISNFPGIAIMITVFALNLVGDGLRDALDPRLKN